MPERRCWPEEPVSLGITALLNQDRTPIDHNRLAGAEFFLHQKQVGLGDIISFADSPHRQALAHAFIELLPFRWAHVLPQVRADDPRGYSINPDRCSEVLVLYRKRASTEG